jgi:hypothetical protein
VEGGHYDTLLALETAPIADAVEGHMSAIEAIGRVYLQFNRIPTLAGRWHGHGSPLSYQMHEVLRQPLSLLIADDVTYDRAFDRFEYLQALLHVDAELEGGKTTVSWAPIGRFLYESRWRPNYNVVAVVDHEVNRDQGAWPPLQAGLFGGSLDRLRAAQEILVALMTRWR